MKIGRVTERNLSAGNELKNAFPEELQKNSTKQFFILHFRRLKTHLEEEVTQIIPCKQSLFAVILSSLYTVKVKFCGSFSKKTSLKLGFKKVHNTPFSVNNQECVHVRTTHRAGSCLLSSTMRHHLFCSLGPLNTKLLRCLL